jgi:D-alanyl-D-alanine dipeptidase
MFRKILLIILIDCLCISGVDANKLAANFVYLKNIDPSIVQEMRYASYHNFVGHPIKGYDASECILTKDAAYALRKVQADLKKLSLSLKVYDCYRPQMAVDEFIAWRKKTKDEEMKNEFYPRVEKTELFEKGYLAEKSGHSRGSTIDLTIVPIPTPKQANYRKGQKLVACFDFRKNRFHDNTIDMGSGYDCLDPTAYIDNKTISKKATHNRLLLRHVMEKYGFEPYSKEWWHFSLKNEPYPNQYFNFPIQAEH